jgi:DNA (cytosine-5)-methyltransferase 1
MGDPSRLTHHSGVKQNYAATLPFEVASFAHVARPKVCVMENVPGIVIRTPEFLERMLDAFRFNGGNRAYYSKWKILSAHEHGVAQKRRRVFVISVREDVAESVGIHSDEMVDEVFPQPSTNNVLNIRAALQGLDQSVQDELPFFRSIRRSRLPELLRRLPKCPDKPRRLKNVTAYFTLVRCSWDCPSPTLVIAGQKPDGLSGAIHPESDRKFTIPELKRLFGLPEDFALVGTIQQAVDTICNMVPPLLAKAVADRVYDRVLRHVRDT